MKEYKAISSDDNLLLNKKYIGYDDGNTVVLTHVVSSTRDVQLHNPIYTIMNNVVVINNDRIIGLNLAIEPYPRTKHITITKEKIDIEKNFEDYFLWKKNQRANN